MTERVLAHRGMLDKYIGDSLMAVFGAPLPDNEHALKSCRAALDMRLALAALDAH
jgi:adenylate cyclase